MAVRFLPAPGEPMGEGQGRSTDSESRGDLAEVIELRSRMPRVGSPWAAASEAEQTGAEDVQTDPDDAPSFTGEPRRRSDQETTASEDGVRLLARRACSSGELRRELLQLGHGAHEVDEVIDEFVDRLYLDDLGLARVLAEGLRDRKRASRSQIRAKLRDRLLDSAAIEQAVGELDEEEEHELLRAAAADRARKMGGLDRQTAERRLLGYLARRGWSGERASRAAREALDGSGSRTGVRFQ